MKKSLFITIGIIIIFILVAIWVYLLFFAKTEDNLGLFNNFFGNEITETTPLLDTPLVEEPVINLNRPPLRQLTTRPVAGFNEVIDPSGALEIYFVEIGTGHLYSINRESGEERRLSGTTIVQAREAYISNDGNTIAIVSLTNTKQKNLSLFRLDRETNSLIEVITEVAQDFYLKNNYLYFTVAEVGGLEAYAYKLDTLTKETVFSLPFNEARIQWGENPAGPHYVYPKASYALQGFLYEINAGKLNRLPLEGFGFSALVGKDTILFTKITDQVPMSYLYDRVTNQIQNFEQAVLPEKCLILDNTTDFVCPLSQTTKLPQKMPDLWYQGNISFADSLFQINATSGWRDMIVDILAVSGREIDVLKLSYDANFAAFFFTNKNDNSLWMYESYN